MDKYVIAPNEKGGFIVHVTRVSGGVGFSPNFKTKEQAESWIVAQTIGATH